MKESIRVKLSLAIWGAIALVVVVVAVFVFTKEDVAEGSAVAPQPTTEMALFQGVAQDAILSGEVDGMAITIIERDGSTYKLGYGSLAEREITDIPELAPLRYMQQLLLDVECGSITLEQAVEAVVHPKDCSPFSLNGASHYAIMLLNEGAIGNERLISRAAARELLSADFGWNEPQYMSLLSAESMEFCAQRSAMIVDREAGMAIVIVVDSEESLDKISFAAIRSKIASVAATME